MLGLIVGLWLGAAVMAQGFAAGPASPLITPAEFAGLHRIMESSKDQRDAVERLVAGIMAELRQSDLKQEEVTEGWRKLPEEKRTAEARAEFIKNLMALNPDTAAMRTQFFRDVRALLTPAQEERWPAYERFLRRERLLGEGECRHKPLDRTNLLGVIELIEVTPEERAAIAVLLATYEQELDLLLREFEQAAAEVDRKLEEIGPADTEELLQRRRAASKPIVDASAKLSPFHCQYVRRISAELAPGRAEAFRKAYERVSLPEAFGFESQVVLVQSAPGLAGLDEAKRDRLAHNARELMPLWDQYSLRIATMERGIRPVAPADQAVDMSEWDKVRLERWEKLGEAAKVVQATLSEDEWKRLWEEVNRQERGWKGKLSR